MLKSINPQNTTRLTLTLALALICPTILKVAVPLCAQVAATQATRSSETSVGKQIFASSCAACHGLDGTGTQRAPNIVNSPQVQKLSQRQLSQVVNAGVPSAGMPSFRSLGTNKIKAVTSYIRLLQGKAEAVRLPGDPTSGEKVFFGKGECSNCHMASGRGGFIAPDLTAYGQTHSAEEIGAAITNPTGRHSPYGMVTVAAMDGQHYEGVVRNEDNFSLQLQSVDGMFHFLSKSNVKSIDRMQSIMPGDYSSRLSEPELNDLVSYLLTIAESVPRIDHRRHQNE